MAKCSFRDAVNIFVRIWKKHLSKSTWFAFSKTPKKAFTGHVQMYRLHTSLHPRGVILHTPWCTTPNNRKICTPYVARGCICIRITSTFQLMIIRTLSSKWETGSDLSFLLKTFYSWQGRKTHLCVLLPLPFLQKFEMWMTKLMTGWFCNGIIDFLRN